MGHLMSHKWSLFHCMAQKVTLIVQLKLNIITGHKESPSCTTGVNKLPFMQKCLSRFVTIKFVKENVMCNVWWMLCLMFFIDYWRRTMSIQYKIFWIVVRIILDLEWK